MTEAYIPGKEGENIPDTANAVPNSDAHQPDKYEGLSVEKPADISASENAQNEMTITTGTTTSVPIYPARGTEGNKTEPITTSDNRVIKVRSPGM